MKPGDFPKLPIGLLVLLGIVIVWRVASPDAPETITSNTHNHDIGESVTLSGDGWIPCGSTPEALDQLINWQVRHDVEETKHTMRDTLSLPLFPGTRVKIIDDKGFIIRAQKVRILTDTLKGTTVGRTCWVDAEMLR